MDINADPIARLRDFAEVLADEQRHELLHIADDVQRELDAARVARLPLAFDPTAPREVRLAELEIELCNLRATMPVGPLGTEEDEDLRL